jgi:hypothetical protein
MIQAAFPFCSLQIELFWLLLLKSASDFYPRGTMDPHHLPSFPVPQLWWTRRDPSSLPPAISEPHRQSDLHTLFTVSMAKEWRSPLASRAPVLPLVGSTWTAVMTNNPSCIEPGNPLSLNPQLLLLSQVDQDEWPPPFVLDSTGLPSSAKSGRAPYIPLFKT